MESCVLTLLVVGGGGQDAGGVIDPKFGGAGLPEVPHLPSVTWHSADCRGGAGR